MSASLPIEIFTDGSSLNNPGPSGFSYIIRYWKDDESGMPVAEEFEHKQGFRSSTNNRMEIMGALFGVRDVLQRIEKKEFENNMIVVNSDSKYLCDAINKRWIDKWPQNGWMTSTQFPVKNKDLWEQIIEMLQNCQKLGVSITFSHVYGHNGNEYNEKADKLAVEASNDTANHSIDAEYEKNSKNRRMYNALPNNN